MKLLSSTIKGSKHSMDKIEWIAKNDGIKLLTLRFQEKINSDNLKLRHKVRIA
ncbi:hypothetical protein MTR_5g031420 [Medicago truncatula]|uniref:Uncharacterized protein n=1 Tax=Medicago truncatula TaxID=3880 RepID=G7KGJ5_MEDTR|nr:hypothetical protein MTR_5g031420 [Medicago truncatula]